MNSSTKFIFAALALGCLLSPAYADMAECAVSEQNQAHALLAKAEAAEKAGKNRDAYSIVTGDIIGCVKGKANEQRVQAVLSKSTRKLGDEAGKNGKHADAFDYYYRGGHKLEGERAQMNLAKSRSNDANTVGNVMGFFKTTREHIGREAAQNIDRGSHPARLAAIDGYEKELRALAKSNADKAMADEDKTFATRKSGGGGSSLKELERARAWLGLMGQERQANERAEKRGDTVMADDARSSLTLAIDYYEFAGKEAKVKKVKDKARGLGDAHAKKGDKKLAADYYVIAGLDDKASKLEQAHEVEKEKAEVKRQDKFKKDQKSLEKELGL